MSRRSCCLRHLRSTRQSRAISSRQTTITRSGNPDSSRGSRNTVARQPRGMCRGIARRKDSTKSCSGPQRVLRNLAPTPLSVESRPMNRTRASGASDLTVHLPWIGALVTNTPPSLAFKRTKIVRHPWTIPWVGITLIAVVLPLKWLKISEVVGSIYRNILGLIDFPAIF